jgi:Cof subfamily protein (haloacid dehalogenase superfamily)
MMKIKLVAFDLDGTLLTNKKELPKKNKEILYKIAKAGALIVPATGRFYSAFPDEIKQMPFLRYAITMNGAKVLDLKENKVVYRSEIPYERAEEVFDYLSKISNYFDCYQDDFGWMERKYYESLDQLIEDIPIRNITKATRNITEDFRALMRERKRSVQKIQMMFTDQELRKYYLEKMPQDFPDLQISSSLYNNIEINSATATKGAALEKLCEYCGIDLSETIAFGDGTNDISLIQKAGIGVAVANADQRVKNEADVITLSNEDCGVSCLLEKYIVNGLIK